MLDCKEFVNADEITKGLTSFQPDKVTIEAGRIKLNRINELIKQKVYFAFETTLSARTYSHLIKKAQSNGYFVTLVYFWLSSVDLAKERLKPGVICGGYDIADETISRRYITGLENLAKIYSPLCDYWMIIDNSEHPSELIAEGFQDKEIQFWTGLLACSII